MKIILSATVCALGLTAAAGQAPPPRPAGDVNGPVRPAGTPFAQVMVDCDLVTVLHQVFMPVPGAAPGTWYEAYTFDTFRVRNGKLAEHWDAATLPAPPPAG